MKLHLFIHEKITQKVIENFIKTNSDDHYIVLDNRSTFQREYPSQVFLVREKQLQKVTLRVLSSGNIEKVVFHSLNLSFTSLLLSSIFSGISITWVIWGFDLYNLPRIRNSLLLPMTGNVYKNQRKTYNLGPFKIELSNKYKIYRLTRNLFGEIRQYKEIEAVLTEIDEIATYLKQDYDFFLRYYPRKVSYKHLRFLSINQYINLDLLDSSVERNSIWVGNSNSYENNYFDCLAWLAQRNILSNKVVVPLSYGADNYHKKAVCKLGQEFFQDNFIPLTEFVSLDDYTGIINSVRVAIFFHLRQQAMGTIISLMYSGAAVILSERNPSFEFFRGIGAVLWSYESIDFDLPEITPIQIDKNRKALSEYFKEENVLRDMKNI